jgi:hypothetical protein
MKKLLLVLTLLAATTAHADYYDWRHHHPQREVVRVERNGGDVLIPLLIGGITGAAIANANQQPVVVQQPQTVIVQTQTVCTSWKEIQQPDGQIYRERNCYQR